MAVPRLPLPFSWPRLATGFETLSPTARSVKAAARIRAYHPSTPRCKPAAVPQQTRYGTANEPPPHLGGGKAMPPSTAHDATEQARLPKIGEKLQRAGEASVRAEDQEFSKKGQRKISKPAKLEDAASLRLQSDPMLDPADPQPSADGPRESDTPRGKPLNSLLNQVPDPGQHAEDQGPKPTLEDEHPDASFDEHSPPVKAPHISTPRHVHHFDTYGLVRRLVDAGWSEAQAITIMKGVRVRLAENMDMAREALVSKSQVENETYLFRAACAELKTEVTTRRRAEQEKMRTERTQLQHEVDILSQRLGQESAALKDELKGMFDDRKMTVRNEQRNMESKVQRLNYQITIDLQADAKSEVEGVRWVLTRRVILALGIVVFMVVGSLKLYSNVSHEEELAAKRRARQKTSGTQTDAGSSGNSSSGTGDGIVRPELVGGEVFVKEGDNPALVSLG